MCEKKKLIAIFIILIALGLIIMTYGLIMKALFKGDMILKDFMNYKLFDLKIFGARCCSLWPFSHLVLYAVLAFIFPDCLIVLFVIGVIWELLEMSGDFILSRSASLGKKRETITSEKVEYNGVWVQGNFKDLIFNAIGLAIGFGLRKGWDAARKKSDEQKKLGASPPGYSACDRVEDGSGRPCCCKKDGCPGRISGGVAPN